MTPTLNARGGINKVSAKEATGVTTAGSTGVGGVETLPVAPSTNIPVSAIESSNVSPVQMPSVPTSQVNTGAALASADQTIGNIQAQQTKELEAQKEAAANEETESVRRINEAVGILGTQEAKRNELETKAGIPEANKRLRELTTGLSQATADLRQFDLDNVNTIEQMRVDASKRDITKRTFNAQSAEANIQMAVQRAGKVASVYAQQASVQILQDDIKGATDSIDKALKSAYEPIRMQLEMEKIFFQRNANRFDTAQQNVVNAKMKEIEQQQNEIDRAIMSVDSAVASGFATDKDVETMTALSSNPQEQKVYADKIVALAARTQYQNALAATQAAAQRAAQTASNDVQAQAISKAISSQTALDVIDVIKNNPLGIKAISGSTGFGRTSISTAFEGLKRGFVGGTAAGAVAGSVIPGVGTVAGGALGGVLGAVTGAGVGTVQAAGQRADVAAGLGYLVNSETFAEMRRLKQGGVTFGSLTEGERIAIGKAADALFSAMEVDNNGAVVSVRTSEKEFERLLNDFQQKQQTYLQEANMVAAGFTQEDISFLNSLR
jgi:hypothetical protein